MGWVVQPAWLHAQARRRPLFRGFDTGTPAYNYETSRSTPTRSRIRAKRPCVALLCLPVHRFVPGLADSSPGSIAGSTDRGCPHPLESVPTAHSRSPEFGTRGRRRAPPRFRDDIDHTGVSTEPRSSGCFDATSCCSPGSVLEVEQAHRAWSRRRSADPGYSVGWLCSNGARMVTPSGARGSIQRPAGAVRRRSRGRAARAASSGRRAPSPAAARRARRSRRGASAFLAGSTGSRSWPSITRSAGGATPAAASAVANRSIVTASSSQTRPAGSRPGQRAMHGTR